MARMARIALAAGWLSLAASGIGDASRAYATLPEHPSLTAKFQLPSERSIPIMGLGVFKSKPGPETEDAVKWALEHGYRMIDTAAIYGNEASVGKAIRESGIARKEIFLATKLWDSAHGYDQAHKAIRKSLQELRVDYLDLYLIHSPNTGKLIETWDALIDMKMSGLAHSIGVSNFGIPHLEAIKAHGRELPAVNQIEMHPLNWQERKALLEWCHENGVLVQAYGSLFFGQQERLAEEAVTSAASAKGRTPAQVLLRWGFQMGFQLIPKSIKKERILENSQIFDFELSDEEMEQLSFLKGELGAYWQPLDAPVDLGDVTFAEKKRGARSGEGARRSEM
ncbi:unnamed protein product [Polarella glacialis]|uniref:NADP-dependent oxidoreductase domain-containing protein n=1 Tax=Polarella glacialis TaxID=89957 RepID=A0A813HAJ8_POLGL|nr:unnamed protein product [Polarella glacialis]CAE8687073.1 unnamed protein product [Polarella glacialis]